MNKHPHRVLEAREYYEQALKNLSGFASGNTLSLVNLTVKAMDLQHASAK